MQTTATNIACSAVIIIIIIILAVSLLSSILIMPAFAAEVAVSITRGSSTKTTDAYSPNPVPINVGDTVIWTNNDPNTHTATSGTPADGPDGTFGGTPESPFSVIITSGQTFSHTFEEEGEFPYYCTLHPNMVGTVMVALGPDPPPQEFSVTATDAGTDYEITGTSYGTNATAVTINPGQSVEIEFDGGGEVELTMPKALIDDITAVNGEEPIIVSENDTTTTISFAVREDELTVVIVPEFPVIAILLVVVISGIVAYTRLAGDGIGLG